MTEIGAVGASSGEMRGFFIEIDPGSLVRF
jgi:hypothetical protein